VLLSPSTVTMLKLRSAAYLTNSFIYPGSTAASVVTKHSIVAMFGCNIPDPLAIPPTVTVLPSNSKLTAHSLISVSVVMMASAASRPPFSLRASTALPMPGKTRSIGIGWPITPVEHTSTLSSGIPNRRAVSAVMDLASSIPRGPLQALAFPLFTTTALAFPDFTLSIFKRTEEAFTVLVVKTPATVASQSE